MEIQDGVAIVSITRSSSGPEPEPDKRPVWSHLGWLRVVGGSFIRVSEVIKVSPGQDGRAILHMRDGSTEESFGQLIETMQLLEGLR